MQHQKKSRPISRILSFLRTDHHPSRSVITYRFKQPTRWLERAVLKRHLRGLASGGVYQAICITTNTGGLLHHRFTLTHFHVRSIFCGTNPADFSGWALPTTLLCEVRTFLGVLLQRGDPGDSSLKGYGNCLGLRNVFFAAAGIMRSGEACNRSDYERQNNYT